MELYRVENEYLITKQLIDDFNTIPFPILGPPNNAVMTDMILLVRVEQRCLWSWAVNFKQLLFHGSQITNRASIQLTKEMTESITASDKQNLVRMEYSGRDLSIN